MKTEHIEITPLSEKLERELDLVRREAINNQKEVVPTDEEKKNGWTTKTLTKYLTERLAAQTLSVDVKSLHRQKRPDVQNHKYNPLRWRA